MEKCRTLEEATVYVQELDTFLTLKVLENTSAVLSLGKLCDEHGYSYEWINGQKPHLIKNGIRIQCNTETTYQSWFLDYQRVLPQACPLQHPRHFQGRKLIILRLLQARLPHQPWLCQATLGLEHGKTCVGWIPIQYLCQVNMLKGKNGKVLLTKPTKKIQNKTKTTN